MTSIKKMTMPTLFMFAQILFASTDVAPYFSIRSQGANAARHLSGWKHHFHKTNMNTFYGTLSLTPEYTHSFHHNRITHCLFGNHVVNCSSIAISGSHATNRSEKDLLADYFYLPTDFQSTINFKPRIDNLLFDFGFYLGFAHWHPGLYMYFFAPLVHTRWDLNLEECIAQKGVNNHCAGYFTPTVLPRNRLNVGAKEFFNGNTLEPIIETINNVNFNTILQPLRHAKMSCEQEIRTRVAEIRTAIGLDFVQGNNYHAGVNVQLAAPTGNRPEAEFLFEPMVGNGHHWELGFGINGHWDFLHSKDLENQLSIFFNSNITHLFTSRQKRTFDLKNGTLSRYMLAQRLGTPVQNNLQGNGQAPSAQFKTEFLPVANLTTLCVDVSIGVQIDLVTMLTATCGGFTWDVGYNFWMRNCEKIKPRGINQLENNTKWALKGDAHVFGFMAANDAPLVADQAIALSATEKSATINAGTNFPLGTTDFTLGKRNPNIGNAQNATAGSSDTRLLFAPGVANIQANHINTSINPTFLNANDINICDARTRGSSSKIFTHFNYTWQHQKRWLPELGIGAEAEFDHSNIPCLPPNCSKAQCLNCALSQWGIWFRGGISFE